MQFLHKINNTNTSNTVIFNKNTPQCTQLKAILCRTSTINSYALHTIKITPNLLFEYQCTSGKFIGLPNQIESKLFLPEFECSIRGPIFEPFCPVDTVLRFTVFYCIVSVSINKIFIHSFVRTCSSYMTDSVGRQCWPGRQCCGINDLIYRSIIAEWFSSDIC